MKFNVIYFNFNTEKFQEYDIFPYLIDRYNSEKEKPTTFEEFKQFIIDKSRYIWWARCEYEVILSDWPCLKTKEKWDIHKQIMMNIDVITKLFIEHVKKSIKRYSPERIPFQDIFENVNGQKPCPYL